VIVFLILGMIGFYYIGMIGDDNMKPKEVYYNFANATVIVDESSNITVELNNKSMYRIRIIGISKYANHEVEDSNLSSIGDSQMTFDIFKMLDEELDVWIEIENMSYNIREKKLIIEGH